MWIGELSCYHGVIRATLTAVDPETYEVYADGILCDAPPATKLPLTTNYFVY